MRKSKLRVPKLAAGIKIVDLEIDCNNKHKLFVTNLQILMTIVGLQPRALQKFLDRPELGRSGTGGRMDGFDPLEGVPESGAIVATQVSNADGGRSLDASETVDVQGLLVLQAVADEFHGGGKASGS